VNVTTTSGTSTPARISIGLSEMYAPARDRAFERPAAGHRRNSGHCHHRHWRVQAVPSRRDAFHRETSVRLDLQRRGTLSHQAADEVVHT
jgi:hypothetical protein